MPAVPHGGGGEYHRKTSASVTFTAGNGNTGFTATATPTAGGAPVTATGTASPIALTGLMPSTRYSVTVTATCAGGVTATSSPAVTFTTVTPPPVNDEPSRAIAVPITADCSAPTRSTNAGATTTPVNGFTNPGGCGIAGSPKDVFFTFTTDATGAASTGATITVTGAPAGQIRVFSSAMGAAESVHPNRLLVLRDQQHRGPAADSWGPDGQHHLLRAHCGYGSFDAQGAFTLCVTAPPACSAPTAVAVNTVTPTSANVTSTPRPGQHGLHRDGHATIR
ncbi:MAG: hypothetical protein WKG07_19160, partial [Hymenobacter sp.]